METRPETSQLAPAAERPFGPAAAVVLAAGIGTFVLGLLTTLNEASEGIHDFLEFTSAVGPLAGKTILGAGAFLASWAILHFLWREKSPAIRPLLLVAAALFALGVLGTFPIFFEAFASD
ncbi:MAG: hypothetical protein WD981_00175 [Gaiellaceae bacterium]